MERMEKLYYDSAYLAEWMTEIEKTKVAEDGIWVVLKETAFYPHGGGQPCDLGTIGGVAVIDVVAEDEQVYHKLESLPTEGTLSCQLDWGRRFDHMQQHSGQHLLSAVCLALYQASTLSFHLGNEYCTIDVAKPDLNAEQLDELEIEANRHIRANHRIKSYFVTEEEAGQLPLVKETNLKDRIRIVEIEGIEYNACGGTHVASTAEIGMIKLLKAERHKGGMRITFTCGQRAMEEFRYQHKLLGALTSKLKSSKESLLERIDQMETEHKKLQAEFAALQELHADMEADALIAEQGDQLSTCQFSGKSLRELQLLAAKLSDKCDARILLYTTKERKMVVAYSGDSSFRCGAFIRENIAAFHGKGGGNDALAQAAFTNEADADACYAHMSSLLKE